MKCIITFITILVSFTSLSQDVKFGKSVKNLGAIREVQIINQDEIIATTVKQRFGRNKIVLEVFKDYKKEQEINTPYKVNKSLGKFEDFIFIGGSGYAFISDQSGKSRNLYTKKLNLEKESFGKADFLIEDPLPRGRQAPSAFNFKLSKNKKFVGILINTTLKNQEFKSYKFVVINEKREVINKGAMKIVCNTENTRNFDYWVTNTGKLIAYHQETVFETTGLLKSKRMLVRSHIYKSDGEQLIHKSLNTEDNKIPFELAVSEGENDQIIVHGYYQTSSLDDYSTEINGLFFLKYDKNMKVLAESFNEFEQSILLIGLSEKEVSKQRENLAMRDYVIRKDFIDIENNSIYGVGEQYYFIQESYPDSRGYLGTVTSYYYNDILSYKYSLDGDLIWVDKTPKIQITVNDKGYLSSFYSYLNKNKELTIIFNDNRANYLEDGSYINSVDREGLKARNSAYTTTKVVYNKLSGRKQINEFISEFERNYYLVPKVGVDNPEYGLKMLMMEGKTKTIFVQLLD